MSTVGRDPVVTVLVATYNQQDTIARCLDSVVHQRADFGIRIVVVDDASTDGTAAIVAEYAKRDARIVPVLRTENRYYKGKLSDQMWRLDTEFWILLEGDDYWTDERKLALQVEALRRHPDCSVCAHKTEVRDAAGKVLGVLGAEIDKPEKTYDLRSAPHCHPTSRLYRGMPAYGREFVESLQTRDGILFYTYLDKGKLLALDRTMSVYSYSNKGVWSSLSPDAQQKQFRLTMLTVDQNLDFRYHDFFRRFYLPRADWEGDEVLSLSLPYSRRKRLAVSIKKVRKS